MKYKQGEKMIVEITEVKENSYVLNRIGEVEPLEAKIRRQAAEITRLLAENQRLKQNYENIRAKGQNEAWELARKLENLNLGSLLEIFKECNCYKKIYNYTYQETAAKVEEWEKAKEEIKVGDILEEIEYSDIKCVVTKPHSSNMAYLVFSDGSAGLNKLNDLRKTGRHIDIDRFLKQIGEVKNNGKEIDSERNDNAEGH